MSPKKLWQILKQSFQKFNEDKVLRLAAALAYYAMFSIGPLLVIAVGVAGLVFGNEAVRGQVHNQLESMVGANSAKMIDSMMQSQTHGGSIVATIVGIVALLFGASGVFGQLQDALNTIWEVKPKPGKGIWAFIRSRFLSLTMVLGIGFLLLISMVLTTALSALSGSLGSMLSIPDAVAHALNFIVSFVVITLLFAMIFKYLPDVKIPFRKVWLGAIVTSLLFTGGKYLLALYLGRASTTSSFGAAGSVIVILMWVYYASLILFFGAEFTRAYVKQTGTKTVPTEYAVPATQEERAQEGMDGGKETRKPTPTRGAPTPAPSGAKPKPYPGKVFAHEPYASVKGLAEPAANPVDPWFSRTMSFAAGLVGGLLLGKKTRHGSS
jgi:membrane protein